ncbi:MAG: sulfatase-like hydrolase/transferase [Opitutae bacterium]|nr:sulfatase-like hydrolase/transferase [Opitutae bacterium]
MRLFILLLLVVSPLWSKRPNVVFLVSEDNSIHYLKHYGARFGSMPNIEKMAEKGLTFNHAFSNAPVCSVARSTLATGILAPRGGFQYHRKSALAKGVKPWTALLRKAGYYCANNSKTDYNFATVKGEAWNESSRKASWHKRQEKKAPFFYMQSFAVCHESSLHFPAKLMQSEKTKTPVDQVTLHPYHPDTPTFRYTHARYFDRMTVVDAQMGAVVEKLQADGLLEDTFVFYFGDHGGVLPRGKGYAYESGLHVPLVVRIPENFKHLADHSRGTRTDGFVSFIDFGPTVLNLAGLPVPDQMDGLAFLGKGTTAKELASRDEAFGYADRFDEKYDFVRTLRKGNWKYIRNYQGFYPDGLQNNYRYRMLAFAEWRELHKAGKLNAAQTQFFEARPAEQLFDLSKDPHEVSDVAKNPDNQTVLKEMRARMTEKVKAIHDLSFYPESHMVAKALGDGVAYGTRHAKEINRLVDIADLGLMPFAKASKSLSKAMESENPWERYWACITASVFGDVAKPLVSDAKKLLSDDNLMVRVRAAEFLGSIKAVDPMPTIVGVLNESVSSQEVLLTFNTVVYLRDYKGYDFDLSQIQLRAKPGESSRRIGYLSGKDKL